MGYRLLALDIDGTLLKSNHRLTRQTREAIEFVKRKGVYVTLATGRSFPSAKKVATALNLETDLVTHDGAYIASSMEKPIYEKRLTNTKARQIVKILENYNCHVRVMHEKFAVGNKLKQKNYLIAKMTVGIGDPIFYPVQFVDSLSKYLLREMIMPPKIHAFFFSEADRLEVEKVLYEEIADIHLLSSSEGGMEIVPEGVSKARGIQVLCHRLGIPLGETVAIGSYYNDKDMIKQAGLGVAMGNAPDGLKNVASWVTRSNNQDGVAYMVREVFRKQPNVQR